MKFILRVASPMKKLESYDRYLFIGPHPDDIEIGAGSTAAKLVKSGKTVAFVIALDGRYGLENAPKGTTCEALIEIRKKEAMASAAALGVTELYFSVFRMEIGMKQRICCTLLHTQLEILALM
jgi:LmbE family N-acetylglucosaminyl deacetylase